MREEQITNECSILWTEITSIAVFNSFIEVIQMGSIVPKAGFEPAVIAILEPAF